MAVEISFLSSLEALPDYSIEIPLSLQGANQVACLSLPLHRPDLLLQFRHKAVRYSVDILEILAYRLVFLIKSEFFECLGCTCTFL